MINRGAFGCQVELTMVEGKPGNRGQAKKRQKSDRLLRPGQEKITINIPPGCQRPSGLPDSPSEPGAFGAEELLMDKGIKNLAGKEGTEALTNLG